MAITFPEYPVTPIKASELRSKKIKIQKQIRKLYLQVGGPQRLKYYVTMAGPDVLCVSNSTICQEIVRRMEREASFKYQKITLPEEHAANMLYINGTLVHRTPSEIPASYKVGNQLRETKFNSIVYLIFCFFGLQVIKEKIDIPTRNIDISAFTKFSSGLTSACLLLRRWKSIRRL